MNEGLGFIHSIRRRAGRKKGGQERREGRKGKGAERTLLKSYRANKYMRKNFTSLIIREMQINAYV